MGRTSVKENKNNYQLAREELGLTREKASELLETIAPERIEKIENERTVPRPDEVLTMAEKYKRPSLCNYYCSRQCPVGERGNHERRDQRFYPHPKRIRANLGHGGDAAALDGTDAGERSDRC